MNKTLLLTVVLVIALGSCTTKTKNEQNTADATEAKTEETMKTLTSELEERKTNFSKKADEHTKKVYQEGLDAVAQSGILESAKNVGDVAPDFTLQNALGKEVNLKNLLTNGPVVLVYYRGGWYPYCNLTLHYLQEELPNFQSEGASLVAISPEVPDQSITTSEKHDLAFEVLSDLGNNVAKEYGVVFKLTEEVAKKYNDKFNLNAHNGDTSNELPLAATYIINTDGKIEYAFLDADYRNRAEPSDLTDFLKKMKK